MKAWATGTTERAVPYLSAREVERRAAGLLAEYGRRREPVTAPPIPIDEILELHLGLELEFADLAEQLGRTGVLGVLLTERGCVTVDKQLDPTAHPRQEGRYRFTLAHEVGHWVLHRHLPGIPLVALSEGALDQQLEVRQRIEVQANQFASCLLMPRVLVRQVWRALRGSDRPFVVDELEARHPFAVLRAIVRATLSPYDDRGPDDVLLEHFSRPLAQRFQVSAAAMRIRLEQVGLVLRPQGQVQR